MPLLIAVSGNLRSSSRAPAPSPVSARARKAAVAPTRARGHGADGEAAGGREGAARGLPFGNVDAPTDAELANVTLDARRRAQRFLEVHGDDVDADVFRRFLAGA